MSPAHMSRKVAAVTLWIAVIAALLVLAYGMHQRANAAPVQPTWQQSVVTIDDEATVAAAQAWVSPFEIRYAAQDADIHVAPVPADGSIVGGEATKDVDGDRITGCSITLKPNTTTAVLAHEVGHCLGLHHDNGHPDSLMYWISGSHTAQAVTDADRAALADLYEGKK